MDTRLFHVEIGEVAEAAKTITETDLALFAAISGDFGPLHTNEHYARTTRFGRRVAHGGLTMALLSTTAAAMSARARARGFRGTPISLGYDRIRFVHPVFIGDTLTARYVIEALDAAKGRSMATVEVRNQECRLCVVGQHVMKWTAE